MQSALFFSYHALCCLSAGHLHILNQNCTQAEVGLLLYSPRRSCHMRSHCQRAIERTTGSSKILMTSCQTIHQVTLHSPPSVLKGKCWGCALVLVHASSIRGPLGRPII